MSIAGFQNKTTLLLIFAIFVGMILVAGCTTPAQQSADSGFATPVEKDERVGEVEKVEVYHFHPTNGCKSCTILGEYAEETVNKYFSRELRSGKLVFDHINFEEQTHADLVERYGVTGSSLMIGVYNKTTFTREMNHKVWYMTGNKTKYMNYLKEVIDLRLAGNLS